MMDDEAVIEVHPDFNVRTNPDLMSIRSAPARSRYMKKKRRDTKESPPNKIPIFND